jgi:hypothetical protein
MDEMTGAVESVTVMSTLLPSVVLRLVVVGPVVPVRGTVTATGRVPGGEVDDTVYGHVQS